MKIVNALGFIFLLFLGCQTVQPSEKIEQPSTDQVQKLISDQLNRWKTGISKRDLLDIMSIYTKNVKGYYLGMGDVDFSTIQNNYRDAFSESSIQTSYSYEILSIRVSGDMAVLTVAYSWKSTEKTTNESIEGTDRSMEVWKLVNDQEWKMIEFILITE